MLVDTRLQGYQAECLRKDGCSATGPVEGRARVGAGPTDGVPQSEPGPQPGWTEDTSCSSDPLLTLSPAHSCTHGQCVATGTSYVCKCAEGYGGPLCDRKNDSANACSAFKCHHGQCHVSEQGEPYCLCRPGFGGARCEQGGSSVPLRLQDPWPLHPTGSVPLSSPVPLSCPPSPPPRCL